METVRKAFVPILFLAVWLAAIGGPTVTNEELVDILFSNPAFIDAKLSPTGRHLASLSHYKGKRSLIVLDLGNKKIRGTTVPSGHDIGSFYWIGPDKIVFKVLKWDYYITGMFVYSVAEDESRKIIDPSEVIFTGMIDPLLHNEELFAFMGSYMDASNPPNLYLMNIGWNSLRKLADNNGEITHYLVSPSADPLFAIEARSGRMQLLRFNEKEGWIRAESIPGNLMPLGVLPGARLMITAVRNRKGFTGINLLDLEKGKLVRETRFYPGYDLIGSHAASSITDNLNGYMVGIQFNHEKPQNFWFEQGLGDVEKLLRKVFTSHTLAFLGYNPDSKCIYFTVSSDVTPPVIVQLNLDTGGISSIYHQYPQAGRLPFRPMSPITFSHPGAPQPIHGYLTLPQGEGPFPTVVLVHGGPKIRDIWGFNPQVQLLSLNGYAVFQINYRGSTGYGRKFRLRSFAEVAEKSVEDVIAGTRWLVEEGIADPDRIAIMGGSFGGYISMEVAAKAPDLWGAAISYAGVYDLNKAYRHDRRSGYNWVDDLFKDYVESLYASLSPINHVGDIKAPVLLIHGKADPRVSSSQAKKMARALKGAGTPVDTLFISWGVHGLPEEKDRKKYYLTILSFLEERLGRD